MNSTSASCMVEPTWRDTRLMTRCSGHDCCCPFNPSLLLTHEPPDPLLYRSPTAENPHVHRMHLGALGQRENKALSINKGPLYGKMVFIFVFSTSKISRKRILIVTDQRRFIVTELYLLPFPVHLHASYASGDCASLYIQCT